MVANCLRKLLPWTVLLCVVAPVSCGKVDSPGPVTTGYTKIDDMEGQGGRVGRIAWAPPEGWASPGFWTSTTDCTQADRILPEPYFQPYGGWSYDRVPSPYQTMPGIPLSTHAAHLRTKFDKPLRDVWGANMGFDFAEMPSDDGGVTSPSGESLDGGASVDGKGCRQGSSRDFNGLLVDLSAYSGFTFWAMASPIGRQSIRVQINNKHTDPRGGECTYGAPGNEQDCYNGYGKALLLTSTFTQYWVAFSEMQQDPGWGYRELPVPIEPGEGAFSMNFEVPLPGCVTDEIANCAGGPASVSFDVWIDDLYFVNKPVGGP